MKPIGPLMREHRLIERMIAVISSDVISADRWKNQNHIFLDPVIDFLRTYADRTHHGKEENILFQKLVLKDLIPEHKRIMHELVQEHQIARRTVDSLVAARERYSHGEQRAIGDIQVLTRKLIDLYPPHIDKEDHHFFYPSMEYFSKDEQNAMLEEFMEFDRSMIHEKYQRLVEELHGNI